MRLAIVSPDRIKYLREFTNEFEEAIEEYKESNQEEEDKDKLIAKMIEHGNVAHKLQHIILAYETIFENACDETLSYIDFKPHIKQFLENRDRVMEENKKKQQN